MKDSFTREELENLYDTFVVVRRRRFGLTVYKRQPAEIKFLPVFKCRIAIGAVGFETPEGPAFVSAKARNPDWRIPQSQWAIDAGLTPGKVITGGAPENPIREAFLKLTADGVGIHGTNNLLSLKSKASHGCIRVRPEDARWLYKNVPVGTPVFVA